MATTKVICDTDVIIDYWDTNASRHPATKYLLDQEIGINNIFLSVITQIELLTGAFNKAELLNIDNKIKRFNIASIDNLTTARAVDLIKTYTLSHGLALPDALIAATSINIGFDIFTYNVKDFRFISDLHLYTPAV